MIPIESLNYLKFRPDTVKTGRKPFRPTDERVVSPLSFIPAEINKPFIGLDGGFIFHKSEIESLPKPLNSFVKNRFQNTGIYFAADHERNGSLKIYGTKKGDIFTNRNEKYYETSIGHKSESSKTRGRFLIKNLQEDAELLSHDLESIFNSMSPELSWRLKAAFMQILVNDLIPTEYSLRVAGFTDQIAYQEVERHSEKVQEANRDYFRLLLNKPLINPFGSLTSELFREAALKTGYAMSMTQTQMETIRAFRGSDLPYMPLAFAATFIKEFGIKKLPVIIPLLGGYDLKQALEVMGYEGEIKYILPAYMKRIGNHYLRIPLDLHRQITNLDKYIFADDNFMTGSTLDRIIDGLEKHPIGIRTLLNHAPRNERERKKREAFLTEYSDTDILGYFAYLGRKRRQGWFPRYITESWTVQNLQKPAIEQVIPGRHAEIETEIQDVNLILRKTIKFEIPTSYRNELRKTYSQYHSQLSKVYNVPHIQEMTFDEKGRPVLKEEFIGGTSVTDILKNESTDEIGGIVNDIFLPLASRVIEPFKISKKYFSKHPIEIMVNMKPEHFKRAKNGRLYYLDFFPPRLRNRKGLLTPKYSIIDANRNFDWLAYKYGDLVPLFTRFISRAVDIKNDEAYYHQLWLACRNTAIQIDPTEKLFKDLTNDFVNNQSVLEHFKRSKNRQNFMKLFPHLKDLR